MLEYGFFLFAVTSLFTLIDPIGAAPVFVAYTDRYDTPDVNRIARKATISATILLLLFAGLGDLIFSIYHITIHAFRITGGVIFFRLGLNMLESLPSRTKSTPKEEAEALTKDDIAITPLGIPLIAGPGAITSVMILAGQAETAARKGLLTLAILVTLLATYFILRGADVMMKKLGTTGSRVIQRIMGLLLMVIAMQFFIDGITPVLKEVMTGVINGMP
ncbi:MAG: NAAT family transporter [Candidatus Marinimicrobia bacterium]|nr:NAAT family transporter [Candidatus Neomarinimicrobiota bacterium]